MSVYLKEDNVKKEPIAHSNGILNLKYLREKAKAMTPERERKILERNRVLSQLPVSERRKWSEEHDRDR